MRKEREREKVVSGAWNRRVGHHEINLAPCASWQPNWTENKCGGLCRCPYLTKGWLHFLWSYFVFCFLQEVDTFYWCHLLREMFSMYSSVRNQISVINSFEVSLFPRSFRGGNWGPEGSCRQSGGKIGREDIPSFSLLRDNGFSNLNTFKLFKCLFIWNIMKMDLTTWAQRACPALNHPC